MADREGSGVAGWDELLVRVVEAVGLPESAPTEQIVQVVAEQPFAARPVWREDGAVATQRIFMGLAGRASSRVAGTTTLVPSLGSLSGAVYVGEAPPPDWFPRDGVTINVGALLMGDVEDNGWLEPGPIREDLRDAKRALVGLVDYHQHGDERALKRAEEYLIPLWQAVVSAPPHPETGQGQVWIGGVQAACAHAGMVGLKKPELARRLRVCPKDGVLHFTPPHAPGPIREACPGHGAGDTVRDERKRLRKVLAAAGCPRVHVVADAALRRCSTVTELRDAASRDETWLREEICAASTTELRAGGLPARDDVERSVAGVVRRLQTPPLRGRPGLAPWVIRAFEQLGLRERSLPTEIQVRAAYDEMARREMIWREWDREPNLRRLQEARDDVLFFLLARRNGLLS